MTTEILDRTPPQDPEAEKALLGSIILDPTRMADVEPLVGMADFYSDANARLYGELKRLCDRNGQAIDAAILLDHLRQVKQLEPIGGTAYVAEVATSVPYGANAEYYAGIIARKSAHRQMIHVAGDLLRNAYEEKDATETLEQAERALAGIGSAKAADGLVEFSEVISQVLEHIDEVQRTGQGMGLATGMLKYDELYGGLFPGEMTVLAARPGVGKTALATQIAGYAAGHGHRVYFASVEMSQLELAARMLCGSAGVSTQRVRSGSLTPVDMARLTRQSAALAKATLYLDDCAGQGTDYIRRRARRVAREGLRLIVVDYLQILKPADKRANREEQVATMTRDLKLLARELNVPVLCLAQLNRQAVVRTWPDLHNLRESGAIEQDADVVTFLHLGPADVKDRPEERHTPQDGARWIVRKNRNGVTGVVKMRWSSSLVGFEPNEEVTF